MIQRIQSIYLLLAGLIFVYLFFPVLGVVTAMVNGQAQVFEVHMCSAQGTDGQVIFGNGCMIRIFYNCVLPLLAFTAIFFYKKRPVQMKLIQFMMLLNVMMIFSVFGIIARDIKHTLVIDNPVNTTFLPPAYLTFITLILFYLAFKAVKKDEELVKSADRLR